MPAIAENTCSAGHVLAPHERVPGGCSRCALARGNGPVRCAFCGELGELWGEVFPGEIRGEQGLYHSACMNDMRLIVERGAVAFDLEAEAEALLAARWRVRLIEQLAAAKERELRAGQPKKPPTEVDAALVLVRSLRAELNHAADTLKMAAHFLKENNAPKAGLAAHQAERQARALLQDVEGV